MPSDSEQSPLQTHPFRVKALLLVIIIPLFLTVCQEPTFLCKALNICEIVETTEVMVKNNAKSWDIQTAYICAATPNSNNQHDLIAKRINIRAGTESEATEVTSDDIDWDKNEEADYESTDVVMFVVYTTFALGQGNTQLTSSAVTTETVCPYQVDAYNASSYETSTVGPWVELFPNGARETTSTATTTSTSSVPTVYALYRDYRNMYVIDDLKDRRTTSSSS